MQAPHSSRKRPAPGTSPPVVQHQQQPRQNQAQHFSDFVDISDPSQLSDEQFLNWGTNQQDLTSVQDTTYGTDFPTNDRSATTQQSEFRGNSLPSSQLVRRSHNQELVNRSPNFVSNGTSSWGELGKNPIRSMSRAWEESEDDTELERRAAEAKRDAQSKRIPKQIPPFIQKLSSFLDADANTDLIRWAPDGNSFIVVDEDEFAKNLIPELFKSDKYASFVRQLNMYGFHKKVGLSDNSMRASEKKAKNPSEYYNPYFKRGRPELLWLIQKSKNEPVSKKGKRGKASEGDLDSGEEHKGDGQDSPHDRENTRINTKELVPVPKGELSQLQKEVRELQRAQQHIASVIARLRDDNNQYLRQASTMIAQHERHENSINAILTFLATFYSRSVDGNGSVPNIFPGAIPNNTGQGNVVDVVDYDGPSLSSQNFHQRQGRRPLALLPAPESMDITNRVDSTLPKSSKVQHQHKSSTQTPHIQNSSHNMYIATGPSHTSLGIDNQEPSPAKTDVTKDDIMSVINNLNANANSNDAKQLMDLDIALKEYEQAGVNNSLTAEQTENILSLMANNPSTKNSSLGRGINRNDTYIEPLLSNREQLDMLQRLQEEQDSKVQDLADRLQPLSPHGSIPGLSIPSSRNSADLSQEQARSAFQAPGDNGQFNFDGPFDISPYLDDNYFGTVFDGTPIANGGFGSGPSYSESHDNSPNLQASVVSHRNLEIPPDEHKSMKRDAQVDDHSGKLEGNGAPVPSVDGYHPGRVVGSVSNSSGAPSPQVEEVDEIPEEEVLQSPRKKMKTYS